MKHQTIMICLLILAGTISFIGCNRGKLSGLVQCEGTVTWKGEPVEGARVVFSPKDSTLGRGAFGLTDAEGKFKATTLNTDDGIMPGEYFVAIIKRTTTRSGGSPPTPEGGTSDPNASRERRSARPMPEKMTETYHVPPVYANKETSGLSAVISQKGNKELLFELVGEITNRPAR